jgi:putative ABC transport system permease protein
MIRHYLASTFASIVRSPLTTAANVLTLALGLACFIAAYGIVSYWRSGDSHHANAPRTFVVGEGVTASGQDRSDALNSVSSPALARDLRADFPEIALISRTLESLEIAVAAGERKLLLDVAYVEPDFLKIFDLAFLKGDPRGALDQPGSVVLTQATAERLFGSAPALGQPVRIDGAWEGRVTGVIAPVRQPSFMGSGQDAQLRFEVLASWNSHPRLEQIERQRWLALWGFTFVTLSPNLSLDAFNARLPAFVSRRAPAEQQNAAEIDLKAFPVGQLTTHALDNLLFAQSGVHITAIGALLGLGFLTLLVACVNYAALAAAKAAGRAKETGMRRVLGASWWNVIVQAWLEAGLLTTAATVAAFAVLALIAPSVHALTSVDMLFFLRAPIAFAVIAGIILVAALSAGLYPAMAQMRVHPVEALRSGRSRSGARLITHVLVGVQFAAASFLLILVTVTQLQRAHLERTALTPRDPVIVLNNLSPLRLDYDTLAAQLAALPGVRSVSVVDKPLLGGSGVNLVQFARSADPGANAPTGYFKAIGHDYFATLDLGVLAGRVFDRDSHSAPTDLFASNVAGTPEIVIDQAYARRLGFETPQSAIGAVVYVPASFTQAFSQAAQPARVIGVTQTEPTQLESGDAEGTIYTYTPKAPWGGQYPLARLDPGRVEAAIAAITGLWDRLAPETPVNIRFYDELFEQGFRTYSRIGRLFLLLAGTAFVIASIGLLGIAVHAASRRRHEIAVRKTLGSSVAGVVRLLLSDFSIPVLIGNLLAWPLAYLAAQAYLSAFAQRIELSPAPFLISMAITLLIAWAAIIGVVLKAASVRPAEVLRHA